MGKRTDAATELDRVLRRLEDRFDGSAVDALAGEGAVEVDHVQPLETLVLEGLSLGAGIIVVDGGLVHVAELETNALAILEVDGGEKDHAQTPSTMTNLPTEAAWRSFTTSW
jgi:hypothetical protein